MAAIQPRVQVFSSHQELAKGAAELVLVQASEAVVARGQFTWVLSGGGTPKPLYERLSRAPYDRAFPWKQSHFFWADERSVPPEHPESNFGQVQKLLLDYVTPPVENIHRIRGEVEPIKAAAEYEKLLKRVAYKGSDWPQFDLLLLGMGDDGHTASLFPGPIGNDEKNKGVMAVTADYDGRPANRVTLTPLVMNNTRQVFVLVVGAKKSKTVAATLEGPYRPEKWPVQRIQPESGLVTWLLDEAAAGDLKKTE